MFLNLTTQQTQDIVAFAVLMLGQRRRRWTKINPTLVQRILFAASNELDIVVDNVSIGGSVVEFSPATRVARVRFPADAAFSNTVYFLFFITFEYTRPTTRVTRARFPANADYSTTLFVLDIISLEIKYQA